MDCADPVGRDSVTHNDESVLASATCGGRRLVASVSTQISHPEWDRFLESTVLGHFQQASTWAAIKAEERWQPLRVIVREGATICGGFQILVRRTRFGKVGFLSKGPVIPANSSASPLGGFILEQLVAVARQNGLLALISQAPDFDSETTALMLQRGCVPFGLSSIIEATHYLELAKPGQDWRAEISRTAQKHLRRAVKNGLTSRVGDEADLPMFFDLMLGTCVRQGTDPNPATLEAVRTLWQHFRKADQIRISFVEHSGRVLACIMSLRFGKRVTLWKKGWNSEGLKLYPNDLVFYEAMEWAESIGAEIVDFVGMDPEMARAYIAKQPFTPEQIASRYFFLTRFGGVSQILPAAVIYFPNPVLRFLYPKITPLLQWWEKRKKAKKERARQEAHQREAKPAAEAASAEAPESPEKPEASAPKEGQ